MPRRRCPSGFSLVELLIVITIMGIVAALALPNIDTGIHERLQGAAQVIAGDLAYARGLAVANNSNYRLTFDVTNNRYTLVYSGVNALLNVLPPNPFHPSADSPTQNLFDLNTLPGLGEGAHLCAVGTAGVSPAPVTTLEFGPLGQTTATDPTAIWLSAGVGNVARYISVSVNPVTGLATVGSFQGSGPPAAIVK
jgi:prepilin-type N-terminal cleavage/methylation domain-containing protein